jgi:saccharopine dehydrogenase (NAD+, L-lysine-forming)
MNACDPRFNPQIFDAAFDAKINYMDMAMHLSHPHPTDPFHKTGVKLGDEQFAVAKEWEDAGILAFVGMGVEPGMSDAFARYGADKYFSSIEEIGIRDGANLVIEGYDFAPTFSIWTTIEECLNPPVIWEKDKGFFTTEPFSEPETFFFPEGIGEVECVNVEHEEVLLIPRYIDCDRVTFKYGLGNEFIEVLSVLHKLGLDATEQVAVRGNMVSPRDVVASTLPDPNELGHLMSGKTCAGTWIKGLDKDGILLEKYFYHVLDNKDSMDSWGHQCVVTQTALNPCDCDGAIGNSEFGLEVAYKVQNISIRNHF